MKPTNRSVRLPGIARSVMVISLVSIAAGVGASSASATTAPRTPQSIECSKQADAKGLHGKPREAFRAECKRQAKTSQTMPLPTKAPASGTY